MSKTQGNTQNEPCEHSRILRGGSQGEEGGQNETKKNERKPKSRLLMTKTLVEVRRRPAQCAYACTNKESYTHTHTQTCIDIYLLYSTHLYTNIHLHRFYMYAYYTVSCRFCCPKTHELRSGWGCAWLCCCCCCCCRLPGVDLILVTSFGPSLTHTHRQWYTYVFVCTASAMWQMGSISSA